MAKLTRIQKLWHWIAIRLLMSIVLWEGVLFPRKCDSLSLPAKNYAFRTRVQSFISRVFLILILLKSTFLKFFPIISIIRRISYDQCLRQEFKSMDSKRMMWSTNSPLHCARSSFSILNPKSPKMATVLMAIIVYTIEINRKHLKTYYTNSK